MVRSSEGSDHTVVTHQIQLDLQPGGLKVTDLKTRIARGEYEVDSREVAQEILTKMRITRRVRALLESKRSVRTSRRFDAASAWSRSRRRAAL
jgi:hypothetical protein